MGTVHQANQPVERTAAKVFDVSLSV
jgi:hypothetical protein